MEFGQQLSIWLVRLAIVVWFVHSVVLISFQSQRLLLARWLWTIATVLYLLHVFTAFHFFHDWSHIAATEHTAEITGRVTGIFWGGGIWFNHLFSVLCVLELILWWTRPESIQNRQFKFAIPIYGYMLFISFNAAIVFVDGWFRFVGMGMFLSLTVLFIIRVRNRIKRESSTGKVDL